LRGSKIEEGYPSFIDERAKTIHHRVNRALKHVSVIVCLSAASEGLPLYIVTSEESPALRQQMKKHGVRFVQDFIQKSCAKAYLNAEIFQEYVMTMFLPDLNELRSREQFAEQEVVLLMDNAPGHVISCDVISVRLLFGFSVMQRFV
jgi:hypothetical protein